MISTSSGDGARPARATAGSPDGSTLKITNVRQAMTKSRNPAQSSRRAI
jgi:hypothetical protein